MSKSCKKVSLFNFKRLVFILILFMTSFIFTSNVSAEIKCIRAMDIHHKSCNSHPNYGCRNYVSGTDYSSLALDFGTQGNSTTGLRYGDAFDCDVNGDGIFDDTSERFYYINDYYDTDELDFNHDYAVLIWYYWSYIPFDTSGRFDAIVRNNPAGYVGPNIAYLQLPDTSKWGNVSLYKSNRQLLDFEGQKTYRVAASNMSVLTPDDARYQLGRFDYGNKTARFPTVQELDRIPARNLDDYVRYSSFLLETDNWFDRNYSTGSEYSSAASFFTENIKDYKKEDHGSYVNYYAQSQIITVAGYDDPKSLGQYKAAVRPVIELPKDEISLISRDTYLKSLSVDEAQITWKTNQYANYFDRYHNDYKIILDEDETEVHVNAIADDEFSTVTITGNTNLDSGSVIYVTVTSESGDVRVYTIDVNFTPKYAYLQNLAVSRFETNGDLTTYPFNETFNKKKMNYTVDVPTDLSSVVVSASAEYYGKATITGTGNYELTGEVTRAEITVTGSTGYVRVYTIDIHKGEDTNLNVKSIDVKGGVLKQDFDNSLNEYEIVPNSGVTSIGIEVTPESKYATVEGNGYDTFNGFFTKTVTVIAENGDRREIKFHYNDSTNYDFTGDVQEFIAPATGIYKLETWGAQGGNSEFNSVSYKGGYGAYSVGTVSLNKNDVLYIYTGGQPDVESTTGGYNGGGNGGDYGNQIGFGGGGATHIAKNTGLLSSFSSNQGSLLIASGGGSGAGHYDGWADGSGSAGGIKGNTGYDFLNGSTSNYVGTGGTQTAGGYCTTYSAYADSKGSFGKGGNNYHANDEVYGGPGGGSGYYGGGGANRQHASAGGGSSYIANNLLLSSEGVVKHMSCYNCETSDSANTKTISSECHSETPTEDCAKEGNGYAKITILSTLNNDATLRYLSVNDHELIPRFSNKNNDYTSFVEPDEETATITALPNNSAASVSYDNPVAITGDLTITNITVTAADGTVNVYRIYLKKIVDSDVQVSYDYTGNEDIYVVPSDGLYKLETWGAQGGNANSTYTGGYGGYSTGVIRLKKGDRLFVNVGQAGTTCHRDILPVSNESYNGGGMCNANDAEGYHYTGSGGGATHIATVSGPLSSLEESRNSILIVSGGGGGAYYHTANIYGNGGSAGGFIGNDGTSGDPTRTPGKGGTQTSGGTGADGLYDAHFGRFGHGGDKSSGGGSGYYGGGSTLGGTGAYTISGAGGGSGYIGNERLVSFGAFNKYMTCYNCQTSDEENTKTISNECHSSTPTENCAKEGNGYAKITRVSSDATLSSLSVSGKEFDEDFSSDLNDYHLTIEDGESIDISATTTDPDSNVSYNEHVDVQKTYHTEEIIVTAPDGTVNVYTINITVHRVAYLVKGETISSYITTSKVSFLKATLDEYNQAVSNNKTMNLISTEDSPYPVYLWNGDNNSLMYYTDATQVYLNPDSSKMFYKENSYSNLKTFDLDGFDTSLVEDMSYMFANVYYVTELDLSGFDTSNVTNMSHMFYKSFGLKTIDLSSFDTSNVTDMSSMFEGASGFTSLDLSNFDTSNVTDMNYMFASCSGLTSLIFNNFDTSNVTNMSHMFDSSTKITSLNLSHFDTSKVTDMSYMFYNCSALVSLNMSSFDTSNVTDMSHMFQYCSKLNNLNLNNFNTSRVTDMNHMFTTCSTLTQLNLSGFDTSNVTDMSYMFHNANKITNLNISNFDTRNVTDMSYMFAGLITTSLDLSSFKTYNVTNMSNMFNGTKVTSLNVTKFDTSNVTNMSYMFRSMTNLISLDISSFDTSNVTNMNYTFAGNTRLNRIYVSELFDTSNLGPDAERQYIFNGDTRLTGQNGTVYNSEYDQYEYARIDEPDEGRPGYLIYKEFKPTIYHPDNSWQVDLFYPFTFEEGYQKESDNLSTVTLNQNYDGSTDKYTYVKKQYTFNKWKVKNNEYDIGDTIVVTSDIYLEPLFIESIIGADLSPVYRENYKFTGWYTDPVAGEKVDSYDNTEEDITLYAHWEEAVTVPVTMPDEIYYVPYGDEFNLGVNDYNEFYGEAEYVTFDYNLGDGSDPAPITMVIFEVGDGWKIGEDIYPDNSIITVTEPITVLRNNKQDKPPLKMPTPTNGDKYFAGWYPFGEFDKDPYTDEYYYGGGDITFVAKWVTDPVNLTIDGKTKVVERGTEYVVPNGKLTDDDYITIHVNDWLREIDKDVKIGYGKTINYQTINGTNYEPGYKYIVNEDTTVITNTNNDKEVVMDPYIETPTTIEKDSILYVFNGWLFNNWDYVDPMDISIDLNKIKPSDIDLNGQGIFAEYSTYDPETQALIHYKDEYTYTDFTKVVDKGYEFVLEDKSIEESVDIQLVDNIDSSRSRGRLVVNATLNHYLINNNEYAPDESSYIVNEDTEIELVRVISTSGSVSGYGFLIDVEPPARVNDYIANNYLFMGIFTEENGEGLRMNIRKMIESHKFYESTDRNINGWIYFLTDPNIILTVDDEVSIIEKGPGNIPSAKVKDNDNYVVTFDYNDGETDSITKNIQRSYTFDGYLIDDTKYAADSEYDYEEDTYMTSTYIVNNIYPEFPEDPVKDDLEFIGWYTDKVDGELVENFENISEDTTLYARYKSPLPTDFTLDSDDLTLVISDVHQIDVTFDPADTTDALTYTGYDEDIISVADGLITAIGEGETEITVGTENTDITKTINVKVLNNKITSSTLSVLDKNTDRIIIGEEPQTLIKDFLDKIDNDNSYLTIYDKEDNLISESDYESMIVTSDMKLKLVINDTLYDEVLIIIRGDIDGDGIVDVTDESMLMDHILEIEELTGYKFYAADLEEDELLDVSDEAKLMDYILEIVHSLN